MSNNESASSAGNNFKPIFNDSPIVISFGNQKGGVGKTAASTNVAGALAKRGYKVLFLDFDQQRNATGSFTIEEETDTIFTFLSNPKAEPKFVNVAENIDLMLGDIKLANFDLIVGSQFDKYNYVRKRFAEFELSHYDFVICDLPPAIGLTTTNALVMSDFLFIPLYAQKFSIEGLLAMIGLSDDIKTINPKFELAGVFFSKFESQTKLSQAMADALKASYSELLFETCVRKNVSIEEAPSQGLPVTHYAPDSPGAKDYQKLTDEILLRVMEKRVPEANQAAVKLGYDNIATALSAGKLKDLKNSIVELNLVKP